MGNHCVRTRSEGAAVAVDRPTADEGMVVVTYECPPCGCRWEVTF